MLYTDMYLAPPTVLVTRKDARKVNGLEELAGESMASIEGYVETDLLKQNYPKIEVYPVKDTVEELRAVSEGKAFAAQGDLPVIAHHINTLGIENLQVASLSALQSDQTRFGLPKNAKTLQSIINKSLQHISYGGENACLPQMGSV